jgi:hypothetical protein
VDPAGRVPNKDGPLAHPGGHGQAGHHKRAVDQAEELASGQVVVLELALIRDCEEAGGRAAGRVQPGLQVAQRTLAHLRDPQLYHSCVDSRGGGKGEIWPCQLKSIQQWLSANYCIV